jgi:hypothetical protein
MTTQEDLLQEMFQCGFYDFPARWQGGPKQMKARVTVFVRPLSWMGGRSGPDVSLFFAEFNETLASVYAGTEIVVATVVASSQSTASTDPGLCDSLKRPSFERAGEAMGEIRQDER